MRDTLGKTTGVAILISDRENFRARKIIRGKEGCYLMIKGSVPQEDIEQFLIIVSLTGEYQNMSGKPERIARRYKCTTIVGDFSLTQSVVDRSSR